MSNLGVQRVIELPQPPARPEQAHKGTFGRVLIVAGSRGMSGAACLCGLGALRGGAGLVFVATPMGIAPTVAAMEPSYLTLPLAEDDHGRLSIEAQLTLADALKSASALAVGPGWGRSDDLQRLAHWLYTTAEAPMVIDADALNELARLPGVLSAHPRGDGEPVARILTPHPGEFARLLGVDSTSYVQQRREELAARFAQEHEVILVLKGRRTIITDGARLAVNTTGNSGMATGGTGDVLTGLVAALLAQGMAGFDAAQLGAHLHGLAGDLAAADLSKAGLIASDLPRYLGRAWQQFAEI